MNYKKNLHKYAVFVLSFTFILVIAGALVTSTGSALSVPDWPLSYGKLLPPMVGGIKYEHTHRMIAAFVGLLTIGLVFVIWKAEERKWIRWLSIIALAAIIIQGTLGGLTVLFRLPVPISVAHATLGQTFFCVIAALAVFTSESWKKSKNYKVIDSSSKFSLLTLFLTASVFIQLILGALMRHTNSGLAVATFPLAYGYFFPPLNSSAIIGYNNKLIGMGLRTKFTEVSSGQILIHLLHRYWAVIVTILLIITVINVFKNYRNIRQLFIPSLLLICLIFIQISLGAFTVLSRKNPAVTTAHVACGALILVLSFVLTLWSYRLKSAESFLEKEKPAALGISSSLETIKT